MDVKLILICVLIIFIFYTLNKNSYLLQIEQSLQDPYIQKIRENFKKINPKFGNVPIVLSTRESYTENKEYIAMCVIDPKTGMYYDFNIVMYVALHELAHYITRSHGHNQEFLRNFRMLLSEAQKKGVYRPIEPPETYCE